jgi:hypothetical protein
MFWPSVIRYSRKRSQKMGANWAAGLTVQATHLGIQQWQHRNDYKHHIGRPIDKEHELILNRAIMREMVLGPLTIIPGDKHKVQCNLMKLLRKPLRICKSWWPHVHTARQRFLQIQKHNNELIRKSKESSRLH